MKGYTNEEADEFLEKVDDVNQQIQDIISGKVDCVEADRKFKEDEKMNKIKAEIKERETEEKRLKGVPGKGYKRTGWKTFCKYCKTEWFIEGIDKCTECGRETVTFDDRMEELQG